MSKKVYCTAQFQPKAGLEDEVFAKLQALEPNAHREDACILYTSVVHSLMAIAFPSYFMKSGLIWKALKLIVSAKR